MSGAAVTERYSLSASAVEVRGFAEGRGQLSRDALIAVLLAARDFGRGGSGDLRQQQSASWEFLLGYLAVDFALEDQR